MVGIGKSHRFHAKKSQAVIDFAKKNGIEVIDIPLAKTSNVEAIQIIRYKNRKLYSKTLSTYVTLTDIRDMIKSGKSVQIVDADSNDITPQTLAQVLASTGNVPVSMLEFLIGKN